ncbi:hypothetical protein [Caballeronia sp. NCTM5]|uniref:hypothetical protein n=1 Tax=Caballeronia sp. NCTM5 TaxID=2921755 RepID=UPI00202807D1|nr:hypothetical protein [Caballeronia sp. NCTM5]
MTQKIKPGTKRWNVLRELLTRGERGLTCFDAVYVCHDYVLRSTVSELQSFYGIRIDRRTDHVPNAFDGKTTCSRYWLASDQHELAAEILGLQTAATLSE